MKYSLYINQKQAIDLGITNVNQAHVFDLLSHASTWAQPSMIDGEVFYFAARQKVCSELPLIDMKPDTVYRHYKSLDQLGLIVYVKDGKKDMIRLTDLGKSYHSDTMSDLNPSTYVGNKSENDENSDLNPEKLGNKSEKHSEMNPTYKNNQSNPTTKESKDGPSAFFDDFFNVYPEGKNKKADKREVALEAWIDGGCSEIAPMIIEDVEFRKKNHSTWVSGFSHSPENYLKDQRWKDPVVCDGKVVPKPASEYFPDKESVIEQIKQKFSNRKFELSCSVAKGIWPMLCSDFNNGRIDKSLDAFLVEADKQYQVMADNR